MTYFLINLENVIQHLWEEEKDLLKDQSQSLACRSTLPLRSLSSCLGLGCSNGDTLKNVHELICKNFNI